MEIDTKMLQLPITRGLNMMNMHIDMPCCAIVFDERAMSRIHNILYHPEKCPKCFQNFGPTDRELIEHMMVDHTYDNEICCVVEHSVVHDALNEEDAKWVDYMAHIRDCAVTFSTHFDIEPHGRALRRERLDETIARNFVNSRTMTVSDENPQCCQSMFNLNAFDAIHRTLCHPELCLFCDFRGESNSQIAAHMERVHAVIRANTCPIERHRLSHQNPSDTYDKWMNYIDHIQLCASTHSNHFDW